MILQASLFDDVTGDLLFPVLYRVSSQETSQQILAELFSERFWINASDGAGGIRTVSTASGGISSQSDFPKLTDYWVEFGPNLALWVAKAAADQGFPDLSLKALRRDLAF